MTNSQEIDHSGRCPIELVLADGTRQILDQLSQFKPLHSSLTIYEAVVSVCGDVARLMWIALLVEASIVVCDKRRSRPVRMVASDGYKFSARCNETRRQEKVFRLVVKS